MEFLDVVRRRRIVRHFTDQTVSDRTIERIIAIGQRSPSAGYSQGVTFVAIRDPDTKMRIATIAGEDGYVAAGFDPFISEAPVQIIICTSEQIYRDRYSEPDKRRAASREPMWPIPYWHFDAGCSLMLMLLAAVNEGLGGAFVGSRDPDAVRKLLDIPEEHLPVGVMMIGHPAPDKKSGSLKRGRRPIDDVVHWERW
jgi:nitroreductase